MADLESDQSIEMTVGSRSIGPETVGPEDVGPESIGPKSIGPEIIGLESIGPGTFGTESIDPETVITEPETVGTENVGTEIVGTETISTEGVGTGTLHVWECGGGVPWSPKGLDRRVVYKVCFGGGHYACLTVDGQLFVSGRNDRGQLGDGTCTDRPTFTAHPLKLTGHFIVDVACGFAHTAVVTDKGFVFCWGENIDHQCGPGDEPLYNEPTQTLLNPLIKVAQVACGKTHTVTISEAGELWTWGSGFQLGLGISRVAGKPRKVEFLCGRRVMSVVCGDSHTVALVARSLDTKTVKSEGRNAGPFSRKASAAEMRCAPKLANGVAARSFDSDSGKKSVSKSECLEGKSQSTSRLAASSDADSQQVECAGRDLNLRIKKNQLTKLKVATPVETATSTDDCRPETETTESGLRRSGPRSPSAFLDEAEAKEFLQKQLFGDSDDPLGATCSRFDSRRVEKKDSLDMTPSSSPFSKTVENLLQHVPSSPVIVQEYVTSLTKAVVSNIRTSMMDRFSFSSSQVEIGRGANDPIVTEAVAEEGDGVSPVELMLFSDKLPGETGGRMLPKSTSMGLSEVLRQRHHRNGSLPTSALQALCQLNNRSGPKVQLDTEVWTWGCGSAGQLGHGDLLDRCHPCQIQSLNQCRIVKVSCGSRHTVALSASSQIYVWGDNALGQLGHRSATTSSPVPISVFGNLPIWDVAAGSDHTLVLCDTLKHRPSIYYCGRVSACDGSPSVVNQLTAATKVKKVGLVHSLSAGGCLSSCLASHLATQHLDSAIYELASNERFFHLSLEKIFQVFVKPLRGREMIPGRVDGRPCFEILRDLFEAFEDVVRLVSTNHIELSLVLRGSLNLLHAQLLHDIDHCTAVFQKYFRCYNDVLSFGGFEKCVRTNREFFEKVKVEFSNVLEDSKVNAGDPGSSLQHLMFLPFERPRQYQRLLDCLAVLYPVYSCEEVRLQRSMRDWDRLRMSSNVEYSLAESTFAFWKTMAPKLVESLQSPSRRLVRDSRKNGLSLASAGRFSWHNFFLFNDCFVHLQNSFPMTHRLSTVWVEVLPDSKHVKNGISLITPEDTLTLSAPSHSDKAEWVWSFNQTITQALISEKHLEIPTSTAVAPPRDRHASHVFTKPGQLKDASYTGMWRSGKIHGYGELLWSDGRRYIGHFVDGQFEGFGVYTVPKDDGTTAEVSEGWWKAGQLHGYGVLRYSSGDVYKGHFSEGKRHGHGCLRQGKFTATLASLYNGQWKNDKRCGYGVCDDITKGNKYMGMWLDDSRHGNGIIVTLDGLYFEGNFAYGKMTGAGLLVTDDDCWYEGELSGGTNLCGKGTLTMANGDFIEGQFNGSFSEGVKVNGTFHKNCEPQIDSKKATTQDIINPKSFGKLCVPAACKWDEIFAHCYAVLGCAEGQTPDSERVWEKVASIMSSGAGSPLIVRQSRQKVNVDELERIPSVVNGQELTFEVYQAVKSYLAKAFDTNIHPLGQLIASLVDVYLATYVGVGAHMRLLFHAVQELKAYVDKIYPIIRILFPLLPAAQHPMQLFSRTTSNGKDDTAATRSGTELHVMDAYDLSSNEVDVITPAGLLFSFLLPRVYPPLFSLYALFDAKDDERYWKRVRLWNKQSNLALMAYLGVDRKFWLSTEEKMLEFASSIFAGVQDDGYVDAIDRLQRISTSFTPTEKLSQIQMTFSDINRVVQSHIGRWYAWSMDDLFPVFQYVVIRARIQHLGAEIHFIEDLIEPHLENGQLGIMFTTLKACYFQILNEKVI